MSVLVVTGTDTGVGKTVVVAALSALALHRESSVAVVKPGQTGVGPGEPTDLEIVHTLAGVSRADLYELARYDHPLSPAAAARLSGRAPLDLTAAADRITALTDDYRLVIVEGAGGLLVRYDEDGATIADLAQQLHAPVLVVVRAGLGTLNATALTLEAIAHRGLELSGVVIGAWPDAPDLATFSNIRDLETLAARPLAGALQEGAGTAAPERFTAIARGGLGPAYGGSFDAADFRRRHDPLLKGNR
jgi:dethiobiotin synthetase